MVRQIHEYHERIGHRYVPNLRARIPHEAGGYLIRTNSSGFRCTHEVTKKKPEGKYRIILFGDSFTAGDAVSNQQRYGDMLEQRFPALQVLNFGLSGTGTDQQYLVFQEYAKDIDYDLLMICPLVENIRRVAARYRLVRTRGDGAKGVMAKPYFDLVDGNLVLRHVPVPKGLMPQKDVSEDDRQHIDTGGPNRVARELVNTYFKPLKSLVQLVTRFQPVPEYDRPSDPAWLLMKAILATWIADSKDRPVLVCPIPLYHHIEKSAPADRYLERFQELAVDIPRTEVCNPLERFWKETRENRRRCRFKTDIHLTPYGHQVLADAIAPAIARIIGRA